MTRTAAHDRPHTLVPDKSQNPRRTAVVLGIAALYLVHQVLAYLEFAILSPQELVWNAIVYLTPTPLLLDQAKRQELRTANMLSQTHAAKGEALRRVLGFGQSVILEKLPVQSVMRRASIFSRAPSDAPAGLGNWDNSCYQNSVLQGLASLDSVKAYLESARGESTGSELRDLIAGLNDQCNNGLHLWAPTKLKSMSSWQQQDAQEYFAKIMDELATEVAKFAKVCGKSHGLEEVSTLEVGPASSSVQPKEDQPTAAPYLDFLHNPLDGLLAQRVACTHCGFSEGLSMIPFNCLTVPIGSNSGYDIEDCLDEYAKLEEISQVECAKCTLLRAGQQLKQMLPDSPNDFAEILVSDAESEASATTKLTSLPPEVRVQIAGRLQAIEAAIENNDFSDDTINKTCQIPKKARVSSTKTRQAVIGRAPQSLVIHINRSVFDEMSGAQRKNYAAVRYPKVLDLGAWMLGGSGSGEEAMKWEIEPAMSMVSGDVGTSASSALQYQLKAVVTHYGRHENGHYICYRQHPVQLRPETDAEAAAKTHTDDDRPQPGQQMRWWRLSDEDVSAISEHDVLRQGGVFMLFYERVAEPAMPDRVIPPVTARVAEQGHAPLDVRPASEEHIVAETEPNTAAAVIDDSPPGARASASRPMLEMSTEATPHTDAPAAGTVATTLAPQAPPPTATTTDDESEREADQPPVSQRIVLPVPQSATHMMRTAGLQRGARKGSRDGFGQTFRAVAAV